MPTIPILQPNPTKAGVPFRGQRTDPLEFTMTGFGTGFFALSQNLRASGGSLQARNGGAALTTGAPFSAYVDHFPVILNGVSSIVAGFYDGTNTRLYITSNPLSSSSTWTEISEYTGNDGLTRFAGQSSSLSWAVIKSPRSVLATFNGSPRDVLVVSDGSTVRIYDPGGSTVNFLWSHATPLFPTNASGFFQTASFKFFIPIAGASRTYTATGVINQSRYKFADTTASPYTTTNACLNLVQTAIAAVGDVARVTFASAFQAQKQLVMVVEADSSEVFQEWLANTSIQFGTGANTSITSINSATSLTTTGAAHGLSTGATVTISGNAVGNGTWIITVVSPTTFTLNGYVAPPAAPVTGGRFGFYSGRNLYYKTINTATPGSPVTISWNTTSPLLVQGNSVTVYNNIVANGTWLVGPIVVTPPTSSTTLIGSSSTTGTVLGGQIINQITVYDPTSTNTKISDPVYFRQFGNNSTVSVQYLVVFDLTSFSQIQRNFTIMSFTRQAAGFAGNMAILNIATSGAWAGTTGFGIAYSSSNAFAESPGFVASTEGTDTITSFGGPTQVTNTGNVFTQAQHATSGGATSVTNTDAAYVPGAFVGKYVVITGGTGAGSAAAFIVSNSATVIKVSAFGTSPDSSSIFYVTDSPHLIGGAPNLPLPDPSVFYDYKFSFSNPWVRPNTATPGFAGGLSGVPDAVDFYVAPSVSRAGGPGSYNYLCSVPLVSPTPNYNSLGPGWTYNFSTDPIVIATSDLTFAPLDVTSLNPLRLLPTSYNQAIPANKGMWSAFKRLLVTQPVQDTVSRLGSVFVSQDAFPTRFQEFPLDRNGSLDDTLGCSATFDAGQSGESVNSIIGNSAEEGISSVYVMTGHAIYRMGNTTTNGSSQTSTQLQSPTPLGGHGTNSPNSVCECLGVIYWLDQFGHFVRYTPSYQNQFQFQAGIEDLSTRVVGDRFRNLPTGQIAKISVTSAGYLVYVAYTPLGQTQNIRCLVYDARAQMWVSDDLLPSTWDFARLRRLFDSSKTGPGQRLICATHDGKLFAYDESSTEFGATYIACRLTTGWFAPDLGFYFGQVRFLGQAETGQTMTVTRTYVESNDSWVSTLPLTDPKNASFTYISNFDALKPTDPVTGRPQKGYRGFMDFAWNYAPGKTFDGLFADVMIDAPTAQGVR